MFSKSAFRYQFNGYRWSLIIFYGIIVFIYLLTVAGSALLNPILESRALRIGLSGGSITGLELATAVFLFVGGLNSFKEPYLFLYQNGVSRREFFTSRLVMMAAIAAGCAAVDLALNLLMGAVLPSSFTLRSFYEMLYPGLSASQSGFALALSKLGFDFLLCFSALSLGGFITIFYYRISKGWKIAVSIGVPALLIWILPLIDSLFMNCVLANTALDVLRFCFESLWGGLACLAGSVIVCGAVSALLLRRAPVRV